MSKWENLTQSQQLKYREKAKYLVSRGYVLGDKPIRDVAKVLYEKQIRTDEHD